MLGPGDVLFFLHIPKTGGVTLTRILDERFSPEEVLPTPDPNNPAAKFRELPPSRLAKIRLVRGHYWFGPGDGAIHDFLSPDPVTITVIRDPVDRVVSTFRHALRDRRNWLSKYLDEDDDLETFLAHPVVENHVRDLQARLVVGLAPGNRPPAPAGAAKDPESMSAEELLERAKSRLDGFAFVGVTSRLDESVASLMRTFGWPPPDDVPKLNAAPRSVASQEISERARHRIEELNQVDAAVYEHANRLLDARLPQLAAESGAAADGTGSSPPPSVVAREAAA